MKEDVTSMDGGGAARFARRLALGTLVALALGAGGVQAAKPGGGGGGGVGGGTVYYQDQVGVQGWSMNPDGSGKTLTVGGEPSRLLHGGYRWFLQRRQVAGKLEIFAVRGDGNESYTRQLTDAPDVEWRLGGTWLPGDVGISEVGRRWVLVGDCSNPPYPDLNPCVVDGGIYSVAVHFDGSGNADSLPTDPGAPVVVLDLYLNGNAETWPNATWHDWSPDGAEVVHSFVGGGSEGSKIVVVATGESRVLTVRGIDARWSPDGSKLSITRSGIYTIAPDGTGLQQILASAGAANVYGARWSPTGSHVTYTRYTGSIIEGTYASDVYRATASGGSRTNLTGDLAGIAIAAAWR